MGPVEGCTCGLHGTALAMTHEAKNRLERCALAQGDNPNKRPALPYRPQKPYIRPVPNKAKPMTIGIGFLCGLDVIMGSDRQMTCRGSQKYSEKKLFQDATDERIIAMIGGDDLALATEVWWKLIEHPISDYESCEEALTTVLDGLGRLYTDLPLQLLCGIATKTHTHLIEFRGKGIQPISDFGVICAGDSSLARYLSKQIDFFWQDMNDGFVAATYILKRTEEFIDGCHGPMDIIALRPGPQINTVDPALVEEIDKRLAANRSKAFRDLLSLSPPFSI
jgi:hypothetical protein